MKYFLSLVLTAGIAMNAFSQQSVYEIMDRTDITIQQAETMANEIFNRIGTGRGTGYKQFQRWLYERKFHTDENGYYISPGTEWNRYAAARSTMQGRFGEAGNWTELGPWGWNRTSGWNPGTGRLSAMAIHPANENVIYVGSPGGGIWKTVNGGTNWIPLTDNLNSSWMSIFALTIDPADQNVVYAGTSGSAGLLKSTNAGASWFLAGAGPSGTIRKVLIHPANSNIVFAAATNGIWRSTNAGTSWTQVHSGSKEDIEFKPNDVNIMYATGNDMYRSTDNGVTWTQVGVAQGITNTGRTLVAVTPANPNYVYVAQASGSSFGRMYKSTDAGLSFTTTVVGSTASGTNYFGYETNGTGTGGQATYDMALDVSPTSASEVHIAGIICWKSVNEAVSFTATTAWSLPNGVGYNHADVHGLFFVNNNLYSISDGGIYKSVDAAENWTDLSTGLGIRQFYRIANSQTNDMVITGGAQDNGSVARQASGTWVDWLGADGMEGLVSPTNHLRLWGTSQNGTLYRSTNGGASYTGLGKPSNGQWVTPLAIHPTNEAILYGGWTGVYKSTNSGTSWTNISSGSISVTLADLAIAPSDPNYIYASTGTTLFVTTNDGATWTSRSAPSVINDIAVDPTNPSKIWIACNSTTNRVLVSTDAGATFTNISANLPAITARTIVVDDNSPRGIYVGMNIGVYYKTESDANWTNFSDNLPLVAINELEIQKASGKIRVATYGRGVWESPVISAVPSGFTFNSPAPVSANCPASSLQATLIATYNPGFTTNINLTTSVSPVGPVIGLSVNPITISATSTVVSITNASSLAPGTYTVTVTGTAGTVVQARDIVFIINPGSGPAISGQPSPQTVCASANASFSVTATGTYQWQVSTDGGNTWTNIGGATSATLNLTAVTAGMNGNRYRCLVSNICGSTNSTGALLTVNTGAAITAQPGDATICSGQSHQLCITATGSGLTYQWESAATCAGPFTNVAGATSNCLTITGATNTAYRCKVTASGGCGGTVTSNCAIINVVSAVTVTTQPASQTVCEGNNVSFTAAASGTGLTYQWQVSTDGGTNYTNIGTATSSSYSITGVTVALNNNRYRCIISNGVCPTPGTSNAAVLTVNTLPVITTNPQSATLCVSGNNTFSVSAAGTGISYQWQLSADGGVSYNNISGATSSAYTVTAVTIGMNGNRYRCVVTGSCAPAATSAAAILTVIAPVTIAAQPSNAEVCAGSNATFTVAGTSAQTINYQWQVSADGGTTWNNVSGGNSASLTLTGVSMAMNNNRYRCLLSNAACAAPATSTVGILVVRATPTLTIVQTPLLTSLLPGQTTTLTATTSAGTGGVFSTVWTYNNTILAVNGNSYQVNIEHTGAYQIQVLETWPSGLFCSALSPAINISAAVSDRLFIFPSPNDGNFTVSYYNNSGASTQRSISMFDAKGSLVYTNKFTISGPYTLVPVTVPHFSRGIYMLVVGDATGKRLAEGKVHIR